MPRSASARPTADAAFGLEAVVIRAALDADFRRQLLEDPRAAIAHAFGIALPPAFRLRFIERDPDVHLMIVLPDLVDPEALADCDLDATTAGLASLAAFAAGCGRARQ